MASTIDKIKNDIIEAMNASQKQTSAYDTEAEVVRIDGNTAWVHIAGGVSETPVALTINAQKGDKVQVRVSNDGAWIMGNATSPPTDDTKAIKAETKAEGARVIAAEAQETAYEAYQYADQAQSSASSAAEAASRAWTKAGEAETAAGLASTAADEAKASASNANEYASRALGNLSTVQSVAETLAWITQHGTMTLTSDITLDPTHVYFVRDVNGDYEVGSYKYSIVTEPDVNDISTYYELTIDESLNNYVGTHLAVTGEGLWLLPATTGTNKILIATGAGTTYTVAGTYIIDSGGAIVASFRSDGVTIGENINGKTRTEIGTGGMQIFQKENGSDIQIANLGYGYSYDGGTTPSKYPYFSLGSRRDISGAESYDSTKRYYVGDIIYRNNHYEICKERTDNPAGEYDGSYWCSLYQNGIGKYSVAEGDNAIASGEYSHAEGMGVATGFLAHAEGMCNQYREDRTPLYPPLASGQGSHAENMAQALANRSHAEGDRSITYGEASHAEGIISMAYGEASHAEGFSAKAHGESSHSEGSNTIARGIASHAQNYGTKTFSDYQTAIGKYNIPDSHDEYALIIGNGIPGADSNALTVDWNGSVEAAGDISGVNLGITGNMTIDSQPPILFKEYDSGLSTISAQSVGTVDATMASPPSGYTGYIIRCRVQNGTGGSNESGCNPYNYYFANSTTLRASVRNNFTSQAKVHVFFTVLWVNSNMAGSA